MQVDKEKWPMLPAIFHGQRKLGQNGFQKGADDYLVAFELEVLYSRICALEAAGQAGEAIWCAVRFI
ncbi:MAG: hypothetical protein ACLVLH_27945 [Eisenbergiella massiliensis]